MKEYLKVNFDRSVTKLVKDVNSKSYWDKRFNEDWESAGGMAQNRSFTRLAIEHLPDWLVSEIRRESLSLVDWGCAQGDGTNEWAACIGYQQVTGVDFSSVAVKKATQNYSHIRFVSENWLSEEKQVTESFDILFSSNTLEHFHDPYEVLRKISNTYRQMPYFDFTI